MKINREQFLAAAIALGAAAGGCKLKSDGSNAVQAGPESPGTAQAGQPAPGGPGAAAGDPAAADRDYTGGPSRKTTTTPITKGFTGSSPTKEANLAAPAKEAMPSPAKEAVPSPTKEAVAAPTKEKLPAPTKEAGTKPPSPVKEY